MPLAPDTSVSLALGLYHNGEYHTTAEVRELTGADEEALARVKDEVASFSTVIALGTVRVGPVDLESLPLAERRGILGGLLLGDREQLFLNIVRVTFGDTKQIAFRCTHCDAEQEVDLLLSVDFPQSEGDVSSRVFSHVSTQGLDIEYRLATGTDQEVVLEQAGVHCRSQHPDALPVHHQGGWSDGARPSRVRSGSGDEGSFGVC